MTEMNLFLPICKVDEAKRLVYGRIAHETPDHAGEVFDYESSKANFAKWSSIMQLESGGKSFGNVRGMHGNIAAGKIVQPMQFNDEHKAIDAVVKVVDDNEWEKVLEGVYTGFSMGGSYQRKWPDVIDGKSVTRYTADPNEVSLVDRPCIPTAKYFDIQKADGTVLHKFFKAQPKSKKSGLYITNQASAEEKHAEHIEAAAVDPTSVAATLHHVAASHYKSAAGEYGKGNNALGDAHTAEGDRIAVQAYGVFAKSAELAMLAGAVYHNTNAAKKEFAQPSGATTGIQDYDLEGQKPKKSESEKALDSSSSEAEDGRATKSIGEQDNMSKEDELNKDAINSEGAKRGASVKNGTAGAGPESANANQVDPPDGQNGADRGDNGKRKPSPMDDMSDEDKEEACKMLKAHRAKQAADAQAASEERIAKSVTNTVLAALQEAGVLAKRAPEAKEEPALAKSGKAPALFAVGKDGSVAKADGATKDETTPVLEKSLMGERAGDKEGKSEAATLIKSAYGKPLTMDQCFKRA